VTGLRRSIVREGLAAGAVAGALSGLPSTLHALASGGDPLEAGCAAGSLLLPRESRRARLLAAAVPVHAALSVGWGLALAALLPESRAAAWGCAGGAAIAVLDLGLVARRHPRIRSLPLGPQLADHLAFGAVAGAAIAHCRR
jgi:hypothetical protein